MYPPAPNVSTSYTDNKLTIETPRALLDSKDSSGKDDDFVVRYADRNREIYATEIVLSNRDEIPYALSLIKQAYERN